MISILIIAVASLFILTALGLCVYLVADIREQTKYQQPTRKINQALHNQLMGMVAGDRALAYRLVRHARVGRPGRSADWYWEKAIADLERDRR